MSRNGSGTYSLIAGNPVVTGTSISSTWANDTLSDIASALTGSWSVDGQTPVTANIPMATKKFTGLGSGAARTDSINFGQVQDQVTNWVAGAGTADAITAAYSPAITALVDAQVCRFRASGANTTTTPTFSPNGLTARTITKIGGTALLVGDIAAANHELILVYNLANTRWELINPCTAGLTDRLNVWSKPQRPTVTALTSTTNSIAIELNTTNDFSHTLTENTTLANPTSTPVVGQSGSIIFTQHASAAKTLAFGSQWKSVTGTAGTLSTTVGTINLLSYKVVSATLILYSFATQGIA